MTHGGNVYVKECPKPEPFYDKPSGKVYYDVTDCIQYIAEYGSTAPVTIFDLRGTDQDEEA